MPRRPRQARQRLGPHRPAPKLAVDVAAPVAARPPRDSPHGPAVHCGSSSAASGRRRRTLRWPGPGSAPAARWVAACPRRSATARVRAAIARARRAARRQAAAWARLRPSGCVCGGALATRVRTTREGIRCRHACTTHQAQRCKGALHAACTGHGVAGARPSSADGSTAAAAGTGAGTALRERSRSLSRRACSSYSITGR